VTKLSERRYQKRILEVLTELCLPLFLVMGDIESIQEIASAFNASAALLRRSTCTRLS
jgi:hypothetical protein